MTQLMSLDNTNLEYHEHSESGAMMCDALGGVGAGSVTSAGAFNFNKDRGCGCGFGLKSDNTGDLHRGYGGGDNWLN